MKGGKYEEVPSSSIKDACSFSLYNSDISDIYNIELNDLDPDQTVFPCGLITKYFPTDTFEAIENENGQIQPITLLDIWDGNIRYKYTNSDQFSKQWLDIEDPRFFVWMKESSIMSPAKLWGRLNSDIPQGKYFVHVNIAYNPKLFDNKKHIIITGNTSYFSNSNYLLFALILILALAILICSLYLCLLYYRNKKMKQKNY